jgi:hypothetical protein
MLLASTPIVFIQTQRRPTDSWKDSQLQNQTKHQSWTSSIPVKALSTMLCSLIFSTSLLAMSALAAPHPVTNPLVVTEARQNHGSPGNPCDFCDNYYYDCLSVSINCSLVCCARLTGAQCRLRQPPISAVAGCLSNSVAVVGLAVIGRTAR